MNSWGFLRDVRLFEHQAVVLTVSVEVTACTPVNGHARRPNVGETLGPVNTRSGYALCS